MDKIQQALTDIGMPPRDLYGLPSSALSFKDGGQYRIEIAGVERLCALEELVKAAENLGVTVHRIIATVGGATYLTFSELKDFAALSRESGIEVIATLGPRRAWDTGRQMTTREGLVSGMRLRGSDNVYYYFKDMERCLEAGIRGFLVADEGILYIANQLRERGDIPPETIFKVSVFAGHANPGGAKVLQSLGANSFNPLSDLTLPMLASIRQTVSIPMDVYVSIVQEMGGFNRFYEAAEIIRICAPCYLKIEPGPSEDVIYNPVNTEEYHINLVRHKVRFAAVITELIQRLNRALIASPAKSGDLVVPVKC